MHNTSSNVNHVLAGANSGTNALSQALGRQGSFQNDPETRLWSGGYSGRMMFSAWLGAVLVTVVLLITLLMVEPLRNNPNVWLFGVCTVVMMWVILMIVWLANKWGHHFELTTQRIKHREGIVNRKVDRVELIDVDDVSYQQGPIQALLGVGNIHVTSSDMSHPQLMLKGIANVRQVADLIDDARRTERTKRGLHIEMI